MQIMHCDEEIGWVCKHFTAWSSTVRDLPSESSHTDYETDDQSAEYTLNKTISRRKREWLSKGGQRWGEGERAPRYSQSH